MRNPRDLPPISEAVAGLKQNQLFQVLLLHLDKRRQDRVEVAIKAVDNVDILRGRAQEMMDLMKLLEGK